MARTKRFIPSYAQEFAEDFWIGNRFWQKVARGQDGQVTQLYDNTDRKIDNQMKKKRINKIIKSDLKDLN